MADVNWNLAVTPDPFKQIAEGANYSKQIFDQAALLKAGSQYAAGDPASAANTVASRGDFKTAGDLSTLATRRQAGQLYAGGDAAGAGKALAGGGDFETAGKLQEQQIKTIEAQQNALGKVGGFLDASGGAPDAWDWAARSLQAAGVQPETIAKLQQQYATNPKQTIAQMKALADHKFTYQTSGGVTTQWDERGNLVQTVGESTVAPHVQNIIQGDQEQTNQWDPKTKQWVALGTPGPRYRPTAGGQDPSEILQRTFANEKGLMFGVTRTGKIIPLINDATGEQLTAAQYSPDARFNLAGAGAAGGQAGRAAESFPTIDANFDIINKSLDAFDNPAVQAQAPWALGGASILPTIPGTNSDFRARIAALKGGTFLQAYNTLKGSGAITDIEGEKATQAIARLSDAQTPTEFYDALKDARETFKTLNAAARERAARGAVVPRLAPGNRTAPPPAATPRAKTPPVRLDKDHADAEYDALPSGQEFIGPDNIQRTKP